MQMERGTGPRRPNEIEVIQNIQVRFVTGKQAEPVIADSLMAPPFLEYTVLVMQATVHKVLTAPKYIAPASTIAARSSRGICPECAGARGQSEYARSLGSIPRFAN